MKKLALQIKNNVYYPFSQEDLDKTREFKNNQVVQADVTGVKKPRSLAQIRGYFASCQTVANNTLRTDWGTKTLVDFQCRTLLDFFDPELLIIRPNGDRFRQYRSISYENLPHIEACNYFDGAYPILAQILGVSVEELLRNV